MVYYGRHITRERNVKFHHIRTTNFVRRLERIDTIFPKNFQKILGKKLWKLPNGRIEVGLQLVFRIAYRERIATPPMSHL